MDVELFEDVVRRVVREEFEALLRRFTVPVPAETEVEAAPVAVNSAALEHPFLLNERELCLAERLLPEDEQPILRQRVYAARMDKSGNHAAADKMRRKADRLEAQLPGRMRG